MSLQERLGSGNALQLITLGTGLSLVAYDTAFGYNFPLLMFGIIAHEMQSSVEPLRIFTSFVLISGIFDVFSFLSGQAFRHPAGLFAIIVIILKAPIFFSCSNILRERGSGLSFGMPNFRNFQGNPAQGSQGAGGSGSGWNMPGAFGGGPAPSLPTQTTAPPAGSFPSSKGFRLGSDEENGVGGSDGNRPEAPPPGRNGYSSIA